MARVSETELKRIKAEVSLERLVEAKGIVLRRHGSDLLGLCPFHEDHEPSLVISPQKNLWHCLGACQTGGSVIDWVMRAEGGLSFRHAVEMLRTDPSLAATPNVRTAKSGRVRTLLPSPIAMDMNDQEALQQVVSYYRDTLRESPEAMEYLEHRGIADREAIEHFQLGYANRTLGLRLPSNQTKTGEELRGRLQRLGILRETGHEHFNGSIVIPIFDSNGNVVEMYGRKVTSNLRTGTPLHMYLPGPHCGVWNAEAVGEEVILCEALIDALTLYVHGMQSVTAAYGIEGFTHEHMAIFEAKGVQRVFIAYDSDAAGDKAAVQLAPKLVAAGMDVLRVQFPKNTDANAYACEDLNTAAERLGHAVRKAVWISKGSRSQAISVPPSPVEEVLDPPVVVLPKNPTPPPHLAASVPQTSAPRIEVTDDGEGKSVQITFGERRWRVRGLSKVSTEDSMKVNVLLRSGEKTENFHVDTLDLYVSKQRIAFCNQAAQETGVPEETVRRDLGRVLLALEEVIAERRKKESDAVAAHTVDSLSDDDRAAGLALLQSPDLLDSVVAAYDRIGVVGEATNKLVAYLAATSRLLERPLAVVMQSSSAAGKSALLEATLTLLPENARVKYSAMTGQSLYYMAGRELAHKVLAVVEEAGAERAAYALKLLQSEGELSIASTGKDPQTGRLVTQEYTVRGPVALFLTTTAIDVDEELLNRCLVLAVDEDREQTEAIHCRQRERETLSGQIADQEAQATIRVHRAAQTLLRPLAVVNPYAPKLTFSSARTRTRRDHQKYLTLIRTVALLHQHQREVKRHATAAGELEYIEVVPDDIAVANRLAHEVLGRSLDELPPQTRRLLVLLDAMVRECMQLDDVTREEVRFTRKEVRDRIGWGNSQLAVHMGRLCDMEYVTAIPTGRSRAYTYELIWQEEGGMSTDGIPILDGLVDPATLLHTYDVKLPGVTATVPGDESTHPGRFRPASGAVPALIRGVKVSKNTNDSKDLPHLVVGSDENALPGSENTVRHVVPVPLAKAAV